MEKFINVLNSPEGQEIIELGKKIKKLDKSNDKKLRLVIILSLISMTFLGIVSLGTIGGVIFFLITAISSFALFYSSKKNVLLKYLTFYRSRVPKLIAMADETEVKAEEIPNADFVSTLSDTGKLAYRMCHSYNGLYLGYAKFMSGSNQVLGGFIAYSQREASLDIEAKDRLQECFGEYIFKSENGHSMLFVPGFETYLNGRVEMKDDLEEEALKKQYEYYTTAKKILIGN